MSSIDIKSLIEKAKKYLNTAELVLNNGDYDTAVSRIYYAMFYIVRAVLITKDVYPKTHAGTLNAFSEHFIKSTLFSKEMGKDFKNAFERRQQGDYDFTESLNKEETQNFLGIGKKFFKKLLDYLKDNKYI